MSGGSWDYLYGAEPSALFTEYRLEQLERMASVLEETGDPDAKAAAESFDELASIIRNALRRVSARWEAYNSSRTLAGVAHAVEWWHSADYGRDTAIQAIREAMGGKSCLAKAKASWTTDPSKTYEVRCVLELDHEGPHIAHGNREFHADAPCPCGSGDTCICAHDCDCRTRFVHRYNDAEGWTNTGDSVK